MHDTLANNWRQRMAGRSALCAVLLAVPVAVAAQISFSAGLGGVPFGFGALTDGPDATALGTVPARSQDQNLTRLLSGRPAASASNGTGAGGAAGTGSRSGQVSQTASPGAPGVPATTIDPPTAADPPAADEGGGGNSDSPDPQRGPPPGPDPTPTPAPQPSPNSTPSQGPITAPTPQPVPGVQVPDPGGVVGGVTQPLENAATGLDRAAENALAGE